jgi:hypothetical protein
MIEGFFWMLLEEYIVTRILKNIYKGHMQVCLTILVKFQKVIKFYLHRF